MKDLLDKLSSYNLFNNFFPGIVFVFLLKRVAGINLIQDDILIGVFIYYFIGMVIGRIGSLCIEPLLNRAGFINIDKYRNYIKTADKNEIVELFLEISNMYRTLCSMSLVLIISWFYSILTGRIFLSHNYIIETGLFFLLVLFLFAYRKQNTYLNNRITSEVQK